MDLSYAGALAFCQLNCLTVTCNRRFLPSNERSFDMEMTPVGLLGPTVMNSDYAIKRVSVTIFQLKS